MNISKDNLDCIKNLPGVNVTSCIVPCTEKDKYATHDSFYGKGGWREVATLIERDAIPMERRKVGMAVYVAEKDTVYVLRGSTNNYCWRPWRSLEDVVNNAIEDGKIVVDIANCVTHRQFDLAIEPYIKETEVDSKLEDLEEDLKKWVEAKEYLTEHQPLDDYATMAWVEEQGYLTEHQSLEDYVTKEDFDAVVEEIDNTIKDAVELLQGQIDAHDETLNEIKEDLNTKGTALEELKTNVVELQEAIGGGEEQSFATKEEVEELSERVSEAIEATNAFVIEATEPLITKAEVEAKYAKQSSVDLALAEVEATQRNFIRAEDFDLLIGGKGYITKSYLKGYATEFYVQDYVRQCMVGNVKPGEAPVDYAKEIADLKAQIAELRVKLYELM